MEAADKAQGDLRESLLREHIANHSINIALVEAAEKVVGMAGEYLPEANLSLLILRRYDSWRWQFAVNPVI